jgi:hypothetical protein
VRRPGIVDARPVGEQPAAHDRFAELGASFARGRRAEVAQPGEALQLFVQYAGARKIEVREWDRHAAGCESPREQGFAALPVARHMIARNGDQLQRLLRASEPGKEGTASELSNDVLLIRRARTGHPPPRRARMLSA